MDFPDDEVRELVALYGDVQAAVEGGVTYFLFPGLMLPAGCSPATSDALLCPTPRDGYNSRLFLAQPLSAGPGRNWSASNVRILERNWFAVSWRVPEGLRLAQKVSVHLSAFR